MDGPKLELNGAKLAVAMFTILPVPRRWHTDATRENSATTLRWLPLLGFLVGGLAGLPAAAILAHDRDDTGLAGVLTVAALVLLSRCLHLDGLADTADGLGSGKPRDEALEIMRRSDIGPFGVVTLVLVLAVDIAATASVSGALWRASAALAVAAATGRLAAVHAAVPSIAAARVSGFGALVAGGTSRPGAAVVTLIVVAGGGGFAAAVGANPVGWVGAQAVALLVAVALRLHATRRLGGMTGDVFGALIEVGTATTLAGLALVS